MMTEGANAKSSQDLIDNARKIQNLQDQLFKVKKIADRSLLYTFIAGSIWGICYGLLGAFLPMPIGLIIGIGIFGACMGFYIGSVQNAKAEYKKLVEQLQQTYNIPINLDV
jgi:hypothetical protein